MLPPFYIQNIESPVEIVNIAAPHYDEILSREPRASLKYKDDDGDSITIGSSLELQQCLGCRTSASQRKKLAGLHILSTLSKEAESLHVFSVDNDERIKAIWHVIRQKSRSPIAKIIMNLEDVDHTPNRPRKARVLEVPSSPTENKLPRKGLSGPNLEDYRAHFVNVTNPTKVNDSQKLLKFSGIGLKMLSGEDDDGLSPLEEAIMPGKDQAVPLRRQDKPNMVSANLTLEGKRQAQLAGEKFRARGLNLRPRKMSAGTADRQSYQNRWAMYNHAQRLDSVYATPTTDAKRQAQTAGDRLHSKMSRTRHVKANPEHEEGKDQSCNVASTSPLLSCQTHPAEGPIEGSDVPMTLLELFESEFARRPGNAASRIDDRQSVRHLPSASTTTSEGLSPEFVVSSRCNASSKLPSESIENGIKTAVRGFEICLRGIIDELRMAESTKTEEDILAESKQIIQNFAPGNFLSLPTEEVQGSTHREETNIKRTQMGENLGLDRSTSTIETGPKRHSGHRNQPSGSSNDYTRDAKIRDCVYHLKWLGFDMEPSRLRIYASVADGDLDEAIDIITEDQRVHDSFDIWAM